jgi:phage head maturation protease
VKPSEVESVELKELLQKAWDSIKTGLVRGMSIGFSAIEYVEISGTWGIRYTKWDWLELSAVTIPANQKRRLLGLNRYIKRNFLRRKQVQNNLYLVLSPKLFKQKSLKQAV